MAKRAASPPTHIGSSIRLVAIRTGFPAETLRAWERRYGFPKPERRPGGSRVYDEGTIAKLKVLARALAAGFRPGEVVPLEVVDIERLLAAMSRDAPAPIALPTEDALIAALLADDLATFHSLLRSSALALGPKESVSRVVHPLTLRVGELWADGRLEIRHEHLATACLATHLQNLRASLGDGGQAPSVLLTTLPGELHGLALDMVAVYLAASGASPQVLGVDTPTDQIARAAAAMKVDVVGLSISSAADRRVVARQLRALATELPRGVELWIGGGGAVDLPGDLGLVVVPTWSALDLALEAIRRPRRRRAATAG